MPISRNDFEAGTFQTALEDQILNLLKNNPGMAYNVADIMEALGIRTGKGFFEDLASNIAVGQSLNFLAQQKKISGRLIRGVLFYSIP
jgi:hypothetical protein